MPEYMTGGKNGIPPMRLSIFSKAASDIMNILSKSAANITYKECRFILDMVYSDIFAAESKDGKEE